MKALYVFPSFVLFLFFLFLSLFFLVGFFCFMRVFFVVCFKGTTVVCSHHLFGNAAEAFLGWSDLSSIPSKDLMEERKLVFL